MKEGGANWPRVFDIFQTRRKENADCIADMAHENYIEMRDRVAHEDFVEFKRIAHILGQKFPGRFRSRYEWVSFSNIPYAEARRRGELNDKIISILMREGKKGGEVNMERAKQLMDKYYPLKKLVSQRSKY